MTTFRTCHIGLGRLITPCRLLALPIATCSAVLTTAGLKASSGLKKAKPEPAAAAAAASDGAGGTDWSDHSGQSHGSLHTRPLTTQPLHLIKLCLGSTDSVPLIKYGCQ